MTAALADADAPTWERPAGPFHTGVKALYVVEIAHDRIKVGIGYDPAARIQSHRSTAAAHGVSSGRDWATPQRAGSEAESKLVAFCAARATAQFRREYFSGVRFEDARQYAAELTGHTIDRLRWCVATDSPNAKWSIEGIAQLLHVADKTAEDLVASGAIEPRDPDELPPTIKRRALLNWFATSPDLFDLPWGRPSQDYSP